MRQFSLLFLVTSLLTLPTYAGVGQGNPRTSLYHMTQNYMVTLPYTGLSIENTPEKNEVKIQVGLAYRENGYFVVSEKVPEISSGFSICAQRSIDGSSAQVFWLGKDCKDFVFISNWEELRHGVVGVKFPSH